MKKNPKAFYFQIDSLNSSCWEQSINLAGGKGWKRTAWEPGVFFCQKNQWMHVKIGIGSQDPLKILWKDVESIGK